MNTYNSYEHVKILTVPWQLMDFVKTEVFFYLLSLSGLISISFLQNRGFMKVLRTSFFMDIIQEIYLHFVKIIMILQQLLLSTLLLLLNVVPTIGSYEVSKSS